MKTYDTIFYKGKNDFKSLVFLTFTAWALLAIWITLHSGIRHDYFWYLHRWQADLAGNNPWNLEDAIPGNVRINPYGPVHVLIGKLSLYSSIAPKLFMVVLFLSSILVFLLVFRSKLATKFGMTYLIFYLFLNFLIFNVVAVYGLNDSAVSAIVMLSLIARYKNLSKTCGILLGIATLIKFYPIVILVLMALGKDKFNFRVLLSGLITIFLGLSLSVYIWGVAMFYSIAYSAVRDPGLLSIFASFDALIFHFELDATSSILMSTLIEFYNFLVQINLIIVALVFLLVVAVLIASELDWIQATSLGFVLFLASYKVGHPQFYISWIIVMLGLLVENSTKSRLIIKAFAPYCVFLSVYQLGFFLSNGYSGSLSFYFEYIGFVNTVILFQCFFRIRHLFNFRLSDFNNRMSLYLKKFS
jgi:hypothetical protein